MSGIQDSISTDTLCANDFIALTEFNDDYLKDLKAIVNKKVLCGIVTNQKTFNALVKQLPEKEKTPLEKQLGFSSNWGATQVFVKKWQRKVKLFYDRELLMKYLGVN